MKQIILLVNTVIRTKMKKIIFSAFFIAFSVSLIAQTNPSTRQQKGYVKPSTGTYVKPHTKTTPNGTNKDNYSTSGNTNKNTGKQGTKAPDYSNRARNYGKGKTINTGTRGGQSYTNSRGNKTYVPKRK